MCLTDFQNLLVIKTEHIMRQIKISILKQIYQQAISIIDKQIESSECSAYWVKNSICYSNKYIWVSRQIEKFTKV